MGLRLATSLEHRSLGGPVFPLHRNVEMGKGAIEVGTEFHQPLAQLRQLLTLQLRHLFHPVSTSPVNFLGVALQADTRQNSSQTMRRRAVPGKASSRRTGNLGKCPGCSSSVPPLPEQRSRQPELANRTGLAWGASPPVPPPRLRASAGALSDFVAEPRWTATPFKGLDSTSFGPHVAPGVAPWAILNPSVCALKTR
jgi:hypothetical protein